MKAAAKIKPRDVEAGWDVQATQSAIDAAKAVVSGDGINSRAMISSLSDIEWGWIVAAAIFGWINTKAKQAVAEGSGYDIPIRTMSGRDPAPWEAGAVETILPALGSVTGVDFDKPLSAWSKAEIVSFSWQIHRLTDAALAARDEGAGDKIVQRLSQPETEREISAAHGGPLLARGEMDEDVPF